MNTQIIIPKEIFQTHVSYHLLPTEIFSLRLVCKEFSRIINKEVLNKSILRKLNLDLEDIFGEHTANFKELLRTTKYKVSGSFILRSILGEYPHKVILNICGRKMYNYQWNNMLACINTLTKAELLNTIYTSKDVIIKIRMDHQDQIAIVLYDDFDISHNMYTITEDGKEIINIQSPNSIFTKTAAFDKNIIGNTRFIADYRKYKNDGFIVEPPLYSDVIQIIRKTHNIFTIVKIDNKLVFSRRCEIRSLAGHRYTIISGNPKLLVELNDSYIRYDNNVLELIYSEKLIDTSNCILSLCSPKITFLTMTSLFL